jgi:hypothetical protein
MHAEALREVAVKTTVCRIFSRRFATIAHREWLIAK